MPGTASMRAYLPLRQVRPARRPLQGPLPKPTVLGPVPVEGKACPVLAARVPQPTTQGDARSTGGPGCPGEGPATQGGARSTGGPGCPVEGRGRGGTWISPCDPPAGWRSAHVLCPVALPRPAMRLISLASRSPAPCVPGAPPAPGPSTPVPPLEADPSSRTPPKRLECNRMHNPGRRSRTDPAALPPRPVRIPAGAFPGRRPPTGPTRWGPGGLPPG